MDNPRMQQNTLKLLTRERVTVTSNITDLNKEMPYIRYLCLTHQIRIYIKLFNQQTFFCSLCRNPKAQLLLTRITKFRLKLMQLLWVLSSGVFRLYPSSRGSRTIYKMAIMTIESMAYFKTISFVEDVDAKCQVFDTSSRWISSILAGEAVSDFLLHVPNHRGWN